VSLELGGKSPAIIFEDADLEAAARYTHYSINHNSGQHCQANSRVLVQESVAEKYIEIVKGLMAKAKIGDPLEKETFQGPQSDGKQLANILRLVEIGSKDGKLAYGGQRIGEKGNFIEPTILRDVPTSSSAYQEEIFGPVVIVNTFRDEETVLKEANCTDFGLFCESDLPLPAWMALTLCSFRIHQQLRSRLASCKSSRGRGRRHQLLCSGKSGGHADRWLEAVRHGQRVVAPWLKYLHGVENHLHEVQYGSHNVGGSMAQRRGTNN
jgi:hypothetical protein